MKLISLLREDVKDQIYVGQGLHSDERNAKKVSLLYYKERQHWDDTIGRLVGSRCGLTSLEGSPTHVMEYFKINDNPLGDLKDGPTHATGYYAKHCDLTSLEGAPLVCGEFNVMDNKITSLQGIGKLYLKQCMGIRLEQNPIKSHILGLLLVKELNNLTFDASDVPAMVTVLVHLNGDKELLDCKEELITNGYKEYAKL